LKYKHGISRSFLWALVDDMGVIPSASERTLMEAVRGRKPAS
jgi:hypothetical protein